MGKRKKGKKSLRMELIAMMVVGCLCTMLTLGIAIMLVFAGTFSRQAVTDIRFYLESTNQTMNSHVQFLEDMVVTFRHNDTLQAFFSENGYLEERVSQQLTYSADLFSDRNIVESQYPFVERIYLFNRKKECISNYFYPVVVSELKKANDFYTDMQEAFMDSGEEYRYLLDEDYLYVCFHIYDTNMKDSGCAIAALSKKALDRIYEGKKPYVSFGFKLYGAKGENLLLSGGEPEALPGEQEGKYFIDIKSMGFGLKSFTAVEKSSIFGILQPALFPFVVILLVLLLFVTVTTYFISYRFTKPLKTVSENIKLFGSGELDTRLAEFKEQELDDIREVFNKMAESLEHLIRQVYETQLLASRSQIRYLQAQINPHFMFNILSMISMKAGIAGNTEVQTLLMTFAKLLQGKIFKEGKIMVPLEEELKVVDFYLYLQSNRFADKLSYRIVCEDKALLKAEVPRLCIEPIVENSASHGLEPKPGKGTVTVTVSREEDMLRIVVADDGVGFDMSRMDERTAERPVDERHTHIGIMNTKQLLNNLYKGRADFRIESQVDRGTIVTILLPMEGWEENVEGYDC